MSQTLPNGASAPIPFRLVPGPSRFGAVWCMLRGRGYAGAIRMLHSRHGDLYRIPFRLARALVTSDTAVIAQVLQGEPEAFERPDGLRSVVGSGLLAGGDPARVRDRRAAIIDALYASSVSVDELIVQQTDLVSGGWTDGQLIDVQHEMRRITLAVMLNLLFGNLSAEALRQAGELCDEVARRTSMRNLVAGLLPGGHWLPGVRRLVAASNALRRFMDEQLNEAARRRPGIDQSIRDDLVTLALAGHETTALALCWSWLLLGQHPDAERDLHAQVDDQLAGRIPDMAALGGLLSVGNILAETMRLYPPVPWISREVRGGVELGGYHVPHETRVFVLIWLSQRDPRYFPRPDAFVPDRWTAELRRQLPRAASFPFSFGPRGCPGENFAGREMPLVLARIAQRWRLRPVGDGLPAPRFDLTLQPSRAARMRVERRQEAVEQP